VRTPLYALVTRVPAARSNSTRQPLIAELVWLLTVMLPT
jgi:hypothetical protein